MDADDVAQVVAKWTGIPVTRMLESERYRRTQLETELGTRVVGQKQAIAAVSNAVRRSRAGLQDPNRPIGSFIFLGPTGVGKTELAQAIAEFMFGDEKKMIRIDMSEYQDGGVSVDKLIGMPRGIVGSERGGLLTNQLKDNPCSVVLLDEIEKAHPDTFNILLQVLDEGRLTDNKGRLADFRNTIIIMTSNIGSNIIQEKFEAVKDMDAAIEGAKLEVLGLLRQTVRPEFINRIDDIVMFTPLTANNIKEIVRLQLKGVTKMLSQQGITLDATQEAIDHLAVQGFDPQYGARPVKRVIQREVMNKLSKEILGGKISTDSIILLDAFDDELVFRNQDEKI